MTQPAEWNSYPFPVERYCIISGRTVRMIYGRPCIVYIPPEGCTDIVHCRVNRGALNPPQSGPNLDAIARRIRRITDSPHWPPPRERRNTVTDALERLVAADVPELLDEIRRLVADQTRADQCLIEAETQRDEARAELRAATSSGEGS